METGVCTHTYTMNTSLILFCLGQNKKIKDEIIIDVDALDDIKDHIDLVKGQVIPGNSTTHTSQKEPIFSTQTAG